MATKNYIVTPLRLKSSRLPEKVLAEVKGKALCVRVLESIQALAPENYTLIAAIDNVRVAEAIQVSELQCEVIMTPETCPSGTDRVKAACDVLAQSENEMSEESRIINIQGDMPFLNAEVMRDFFKLCDRSEEDFLTLAKEWPAELSLDDTSKVKCLSDDTHYARYFSRAPIPFAQNSREAKAQLHIGVYAYNYAYLKKFCALKPSSWEKTESLEQLRALQAGHALYVHTFKEAKEYEFRGIDTLADLNWLNSFLSDKT